MTTLRMMDVLIGFAPSMDVYHIVVTKTGKLALCKAGRQGLAYVEKATLLFDSAPESLSVKLPSGSTFWGQRTGIKVKGTPVCSNCLKVLRKRVR